jgi:hypothetical protein
VNRREFMALLGGTATTASPLAARAQHGSGVRLIGILMNTTTAVRQAGPELFLKGLE